MELIWEFEINSNMDNIREGGIIWDHTRHGIVVPSTSFNRKLELNSMNVFFFFQDKENKFICTEIKLNISKKVKKFIK